MSEAQANGQAGTTATANGAQPWDAAGFDAAAQSQGAGQKRPEIAVGAAFAGGFLLALLLRRARS